MLSGLKPPSTRSEVESLENSYSLWSSQSSDKLSKEVLDRYGATFYQQEIMNATQNTNNEFLIAPYLAAS